MALKHGTIEMKFSDLNKTWIFDLDGTILEHNGHKNGGDKILPGVLEFFKNNIKKNDKVIIMTARERKFAFQTEKFLQNNEIRYDTIIYDLPYGERILFNDKKPSGMNTAYSFNIKRDMGLEKIFND